MGRRKSHAETIYLVRNDNLPTIDFILKDNQRAAQGYYLDPQDADTWRPVDLEGKQLVGWFKQMCRNGKILFGIPVLRHAPFTSGKCTLLGQPSALMDVPPGWYELEIEVNTCATSYKQTVWKRFKFCVREDFDTEETVGMNPPIYRDDDGNLQELPVNPPDCGVVQKVKISLPFGTTSHTINGTASDINGSIAAVEYRLNGGTWFTASGTEQWTAIVTGLVTGDNLVEVRARDFQGACSVLQECVLYVAGNTAPTITLDCGTGTDPEQPNACFNDIQRGVQYVADTGTPQSDMAGISSRRIRKPGMNI